MTRLLTSCISLCAAAYSSAQVVTSDTWAATDALGRKLPDYKECGPRKPNKYVGIFYFLWMQPEQSQQLYDNTKLVAANPSKPAYGPVGAFHWWGEPWLGYYLSDDDFVIRKHAQQLTDAGIDVVIFDVTNGFTYDQTFLKLCQVYTQIRVEGGKTPQIAFFAHANGAGVAQHLYDTFYAKNLYPDLWFRWQGKPLLLGPLTGLSAAVTNFFTARESWAWTDPNGWFGDGKDKWPWLDNSPQNPGWDLNKNTPEEISVAVAQHPTSNIGRSFRAGHEPTNPETSKGFYFQDQWDRAKQVDPEFVWVTGWNEWIAQRFNSDGNSFLGKQLPKGEPFFVDEYSEEYSRDIEPMRGGHGDDYYYQLVANVRRFKGVDALPKPSERIRIRSLAQWENVQPTYQAAPGTAAKRDAQGWAGLHYVNDSGRNEFKVLKVARDNANLYFYAQTQNAITKPSDPMWMTLLLDTDRNHNTGWEGYDFIVNRIPGWLEQNEGGWHWRKVAPIRSKIVGNELQITIPRKLLQLSNRLNFEFKWADNVPESGNIMDFIDQGDVAPCGRFNCVFQEG
jgi:hypothetical protein